MKKTISRLTVKALFIVAVLMGTFNAIAQEKVGGLALYTVRDDMKTNAKTTLQAVADANHGFW